MRLAPLLLGCTLLTIPTACGRVPDVGPSREEVVYGTDDRLEVYEHPSAPHRAVASSAVAMQVSAGWVDEGDPSDVRITYTRTLGEANSLCAGERFRDQIEPGTCSGTLIDSRHILTAGHCVNDAAACDGSKVWVLGFAYEAAGTLAPLTRDDVYRCARVLAYREDGTADHAIVELDRAVIGHTPARIRALAGPLAVGTALTLIGHPNGLPMKIASGGEVLSSDVEVLRASVDAFSGNSGSGVFDASAELVAILDSGAEDYVDRGGCNVVNVLDPSTASGEGLTYAAPAIAALCATPGLVSPLCGCPPPCVGPLPGDTCAEAVALPLVSSSTMASLAGYAHDSSGSCGGAGPDRVFVITLDAPAMVQAEAVGGDPVLYVRAGCEGAELACNDDVSGSDRSARIEGVLEAGTYALFLDSYDDTTGDTTLTVTITYAMERDASAGEDDASSVDDAGVTGGSDAGDAPTSSSCACAVPGPGPRLPGGLGALCAAFAMLTIAHRRRRPGPSR